MTPRDLLLGELITIAGNIGPGDGPQNFPLNPGYIHEVIGLQFTLTTDATLGNRTLLFQPASSNALLANVISVSTQPPSTTRFWTVWQGQQTAIAVGSVITECMPRLIIPVNGAANLLSNGGAAGDVFARPQLLVSRWRL